GDARSSPPEAPSRNIPYRKRSAQSRTGISTRTASSGNACSDCPAGRWQNPKVEKDRTPAERRADNLRHRANGTDGADLGWAALGSWHLARLAMFEAAGFCSPIIPSSDMACP